jgi:hypothetical protein
MIFRLVQFVRDPLWTFVFGFAALVIALISVFYQRRKKRLSYRVESVFPLLNVHQSLQSLNPSEGEPPLLQVTFDGKPIYDMRAVVIRIENSGDVPIRTDDFDGRIWAAG